MPSSPSAGITLIFSAGGIASAEAFSEPKLVRVVRAQGIASEEAFGTAHVLHVLAEAGGIASLEAFGVPRLLEVVSPAGIASAEAVSAPKLTRTVYAVGIGSAEEFGITTVGPVVAGEGTVVGNVLIGDEARYDVLVVDGEVFVVLVDDVDLSGDVAIADRLGE